MNAKWAGVFYIIATVAPISSFSLIGFLEGGGAEEPLSDFRIIARTLVWYKTP
jgi:hypothetical protein